jgi:hypothetical protein
MGKNQDPGSGINIPDPQHCPKENIQNRTSTKFFFLILWFIFPVLDSDPDSVSEFTDLTESGSGSRSETLISTVHSKRYCPARKER